MLFFQIPLTLSMVLLIKKKNRNADVIIRVYGYFFVTLQPFKKHKNKKINGQTYKFECN